MSMIRKILDSISFPRSSNVDPTKAIGVPGTSVINGFIETQEKNVKLIGARKYQTYSDLIANVTIVSAGTRYFLNLVAKAKWKVVPADDSAEALALAEKVKAQMNSMEISWARIIRRAAMYRFYGFSIQEWVAENMDGEVRMRAVLPRPQSTIDRWDRDENGSILGVVQLTPLEGEEKYLPRHKIIYIVDDALNDSPEGLGLYRHIISAADRLQRYEQLEGYGFESDLRGIPVGRAPFAALQEAVGNNLITEADKAHIEQPLISFIRGHIKNPELGLLLDSITYQSQGEDGKPSNVPQWDIDLLKGSSTSLSDMAIAIERVNRDIARILGVEGLLLGEQTTGSHALSKDKSQNFALIVDSTLSELAEVMQSDFLVPLWELNGWPIDKIPTFGTEAVQHRDVTAITQALKDMADAGSFMAQDDPAVNDIRAILGISPQGGTVVRPEDRNPDKEDTNNPNPET